MSHWTMMVIFRDKWNHNTVQQTNLEALLISALLQDKTLYFVPITWQCMLANCGENIHRFVWSAYVLRINYNAYRIMHNVVRNVSVRPRQISHCVKAFDPLLRNKVSIFLHAAHLRLTFLSDRFKCLMLFTNLHFSSII